MCIFLLKLISDKENEIEIYVVLLFFTDLKSVGERI